MTTFLIVDDNREMRRLLRSIVKKEGDRIFECDDGDEVLSAFEKHHPEWVLMDVEMERTDGLKATEELVKLHPEARVIVVTKFNDAQTQMAAKKAGAAGFCGKDDLLSLRSIIH